MKESISSKRSTDTKIKSSLSNLFLNVIIITLGLVIIFMVYSIVIKIKGIESAGIDEKKNVPAKIIQVEVLNGCGAEGVADNFTNFLRKKNFDVVQTGNYFSFNIENSLVIDRTGNIANAKKVADELGIKEKHVIQQLNDEYFLDVSIIIGKDYINLKPNN